MVDWFVRQRTKTFQHRMNEKKRFFFQGKKKLRRTSTVLILRSELWQKRSQTNVFVTRIHDFLEFPFCKCVNCHSKIISDRFCRRFYSYWSSFIVAPSLPLFPPSSSSSHHIFLRSSLFRISYIFSCNFDFSTLISLLRLRFFQQNPCWLSIRNHSKQFLWRAVPPAPKRTYPNHSDFPFPEMFSALVQFPFTRACCFWRIADDSSIFFFYLVWHFRENIFY